MLHSSARNGAGVQTSPGTVRTNAVHFITVVCTCTRRDCGGVDAPDGRRSARGRADVASAIRRLYKPDPRLYIRGHLVGAHRRPQAPTGAYRCPRAPSGALRRPQAPTGAHRRSQALTGVHRRPQAPTGAHRRPQAPAGAHKRPQAPTSAHRRPQAPTGAHSYRRSQALTGAYRCPQARSGAKDSLLHAVQFLVFLTDFCVFPGGRGCAKHAKTAVSEGCVEAGSIDGILKRKCARMLMVCSSTNAHMGPGKKGAQVPSGVFSATASGQNERKRRCFLSFCGFSTTRMRGLGIARDGRGSKIARG
jgi:hypothetical protein